jgi:hypothetical protein
MAAKVDKIFRGHQPHQLVPDCGFGKRNGLWKTGKFNHLIKLREGEGFIYIYIYIYKCKLCLTRSCCCVMAEEQDSMFPMWLSPFSLCSDLRLYNWQDKPDSCNSDGSHRDMHIQDHELHQIPLGFVYNMLSVTNYTL